MKLYALDPILNPTEDKLYKEGFFIDHFHKLLIQSIKPPFAISLDGQWGTGKTTIMQELKKRLEKSNYPTFWFNPWEYRKTEDVVLAFLQCLAMQYEEEVNSLGISATKILTALLKAGMKAGLALYTKGLVSLKDIEAYLTETDKENLNKTPRYEQYENSVESIKNEFLALVHAIGGKEWCKFTDESWYQLQDKIPEYIVNRLKSLKNKEYEGKDDFLNALNKMKSSNEISEESIERYKDIIWQYVEKRPVIIFFDDLDRCLPDDAIQLLEALKNLFVTPNCNCIFVCGIDTRVAKKFIEKHYNSIEENFAVNYFRKIFNLTISMPYSLEIENVLFDYITSLYDWNDPEKKKAKALADMLCKRALQTKIYSIRKYMNIITNFYIFLQFNPDYQFNHENDLIINLLMLKEAWQPLYEDLIREALRQRSTMGSLIKEFLTQPRQRPLMEEQRDFLNEYIAHFSQESLSMLLAKYPTLA